jgi:hypothetical protein
MSSKIALVFSLLFAFTLGPLYGVEYIQEYIPPEVPVYDSEEDQELVTIEDGITIGSLRLALWYKEQYELQVGYIGDVIDVGNSALALVDEASRQLVEVQTQRDTLVSVSTGLGVAVFVLGIVVVLK